MYCPLYSLTRDCSRGEAPPRAVWSVKLVLSLLFTRKRRRRTPASRLFAAHASSDRRSFTTLEPSRRKDEHGVPGPAGLGSQGTRARVVGDAVL